LRAAGHDVLVATGGNHELASHAGLQVVDVAPGVDFPSVFRGFFAQHGSPVAPTDSPAGPDAGQAGAIAMVAKLFATVSREFTEHTVELVRHWHPDLVLFSPLQAVGGLAAAVAGVPSVAHTIGINQPSILWDTLATEFADEYARFGVEPTAPAAVLDVSPPSLRDPAADSWSMRYVPYNGGAILPPWVLEPHERPLVTVTLGSVVPLMAGVGALRPFLAAAADAPADFVVTGGGADPADFGTLPANVRLVDWVPLGAILANSAAVIHHGGAGTTLTALNSGLPQLVLPQGADQFMNAAVLAKAGAGAVVEPADLDADRIAELLSDTPMRAAAAAISAEMADQPTPADLVPGIIGLAS
jgi:hypothetical protein